MTPSTRGRVSRLFPVAAHANLANAITATNALLGVSGILLAARGAVFPAIACGALALPCDVLDGVVARRTGTSSAFGAQLDTLADAISFCLLPAATALALGVPAWVLAPAVFYALTGVLRLARFGEVGLSSEGGVACFEGLPTAIASGLFQAAAAAGLWLPPTPRAALLAATYTALGLAMISAAAVPKHGLLARSLYVVVPLAVAAVGFRLA